MNLDMAEKIGTSRSISDSRRWSPGGGGGAGICHRGGSYSPASCGEITVESYRYSVFNQQANCLLIVAFDFKFVSKIEAEIFEQAIPPDSFL